MRCSKKLKSKSGASLVLAILVFLICALVGSTILDAASASSGTLTNTWQEDKDVYALKSAEKILEPSFEISNAWNADDYAQTSNKITEIPSSMDLTNMYKVFCIHTYNDSSYTETMKFTLNTTPALIVNAVITMDDSYNVTAVFTKDGTSRKVSAYFPATTSNGTNAKERGKGVIWRDPVITVE